MCPLAPAYSSSSSLAPFFDAPWPEHFHHTNTSPCLSMASHHVTSSHTSLSPSSKFVEQIFRSRTLRLSHLMHRYLMVTAHHTVRCFAFLNFLIHEDQCFFRLRLTFFAVFPVLHQTVKAGCILQGCAHVLSLLLDGVCSYFLIAMSDKPLNIRHVFLVLLSAVRF